MPAVESTHSGGTALGCNGGMSSSSDPRATVAGLDMLAAGGNAVDAAVATAFALAVHEPAMSHLGGQGNMVVHLVRDDVTMALDFYACAPGEATPDMYDWVPSPTQGDYRFNTEGDLNTVGALAIAIPGNVCGWVSAHERWGALPLAAVLSPAVQAAESGSRCSSRTASFIAEHRDRLARFAGAASVFLRADGTPREEGELIHQPDLGATLRGIGVEGIESFYRGALARSISDYVRSEGGILSQDDLARYPTELMWVREPDWIDFVGHQVAGATPASNALLFNLLGILNSEDLVRRRDQAPDQHHFIIESMKLAFAERSQHIGDHTQVNVPYEGLVSPSYTASRRALIDPECASFPQAGDPWQYQERQPDPTKFTHAGPETPAPMIGTTHHSHVDRWGNFVSMSQSLGDAFGSCVMVPGTGIIMNNAMKLFDPRPGQRAAGVTPYKRPMAPWPTMVFKEGRAVMAIGSPSGTRIPNAIAQVLINTLVLGMDLQEAVDRPRVHWSGHELEAEGDLADDIRAGLEGRGHHVQYRGAQSPWFGAVQAVSRDPVTGVCRGAADPRRSGAAAGIHFANHSSSQSLTVSEEGQP